MADVPPDPLRVLLVGEGNLSFTYALVKRLSRSAAVRRATQADAAAPSSPHSSVVEVVATTFDAAEALPRKYPEANGFLTYFAAKQRVRVQYYGDVNATTLLTAAAPLRDRPFHLVIFNNPHIGFEDLYRQRALLWHFFRSARDLHAAQPTAASPQEIVVALCDEQARRWGLLGCAARSGYVCVAAVPLRTRDFPEYTNRRHQSDAAFPFSVMVQFYFVESRAAVREALLELWAELARWEELRHTRAAAQLPCNFDCTEWVAAAESLLGPAPDQPVRAASGVRVDEVDCTDASASCAGGNGHGALQPLPLLHPTLVARVVARALQLSSDTASCGSDAFMPYLPVGTWARLYRAQRAAEQRARSEDAMSASPVVSEAAAASPAVPPHLDPAQLGRPLTTKEAKKLERYLAGYGVAMRTKAVQQRDAAGGAARSWTCEECQPCRAFHTEGDLRQHRASKHSGAALPVATLYARVHAQITTPESRVLAELDAMRLDADPEGGYCDVCDLQFNTLAAFEEHLRYLAPLPGEEDGADDLVCDLCEPRKVFTDRRALEQHRALKHGPAR